MTTERNKKEPSKLFAKLTRVDSRSRQQREALREMAISANRRDAAPVLAELSSVGFDIEWISDLRRYGNYEVAIPILVKWLSHIQNSAVKSDIARLLSIPSAKAVVQPVLLAEYRAAGDVDGGLRDALANALEIVADDSIFDEIVSLVQEPGGGTSRSFLTLSLAKMANPRAIEVLVLMLKDETQTAFAIMALGKLKASVARTEVEAFLTSPIPEVRREARKALGRMK